MCSKCQLLHYRDLEMTEQKTQGYIIPNTVFLQQMFNCLQHLGAHLLFKSG